MRINSTKFYHSILRCLSLFLFLPATGQNLIANPNADEGVPANTGWTVVSSGTACVAGWSAWRVTGGQSHFPPPQEGTYYFSPGCSTVGTTLELRQDINLSTYAAQIDDANLELTFSGYTRSYQQPQMDVAEMVVEYRSADNATILGSYTTGPTTSSTEWLFNSDTRIVPPGTRFARVRLLGTCRASPSVDAYFDNITLEVTTTLPVNLLSFDVSHNTQQDNVLLTWKTADEVNNAGFYIERSQDGITWSEIGFVRASTSTDAIKTYSFVDKDQQSANVYYRLRQADLDGKETLSAIKKLSLAPASSVSIYPNPATNKLFIKSDEEILSAEIVNTEGKTVFADRRIIAGTIHVNHLPAGLYVLKIKFKDKVEFQRFLKK